MKVSKVAAIWIDYHNTHSKKNTVRSYQYVIERFCQDFGDAEIGQVTPDDVLSFLNSFTNGNKPYTKRVRYSHLAAFFNFFRNNIDSTLVNPCDTALLSQFYIGNMANNYYFHDCTAFKF